MKRYCHIDCRNPATWPELQLEERRTYINSCFVEFGITHPIRNGEWDVCIMFSDNGSKFYGEGTTYILHSSIRCYTTVARVPKPELQVQTNEKRSPLFISK